MNDTSTRQTNDEVFWNRMTAETLRARADADAIVLLPVASTEQHGPHLATGVDTILCTEVCRRTAVKVATERPIVVAPTVWMGLAEHHVAFGGTFSVSLATWHALLRDLCDAVLRAGFAKILIVNGHGGNMAALSALTTDLTRELEAPIATTSYWTKASQEGLIDAILEDQTGLIHACEAETSMMMAVTPDLVDTNRLEEAVGPNTGMAEVLSPPILRWRSFRDITPSGVLGDARKASVEKGEAMFEATSGCLAKALLAGEPWG